MRINTSVAALSIAILALGVWYAAAHDAAQGGSNVPGDASCDGTAGAVDAALILQFDVGLLGALPCPHNADVVAYGVINAVDAAVILQFDAGLVGSLSTGPTATATRTPGVPPTATSIPPSATPTRTPTTGPTSTPGPTAAPTPCVSQACPVMFFTIGGLDGRCAGTSTTECNVFLSERFTLNIGLEESPPGGYYGVQTLIVPDGIDYDPTVSVADEVAWPDAMGFVLRDPDPWINHGVATANVPPFPSSTYAGTLVQLDMGCGVSPANHTLLLIALSPGTTTGTGLQVSVAEGGPPSRPARGIDVVEIDGETEIIADRLVIRCVAP